MATETDPLLADPVDPTPVKPGYLTTEFWTTLATFVGNLIVVLTVLGRLSPEQAKKLTESANVLWTVLPVLLANAWMLWNYVTNRTVIKQTAQKIEMQRMQFRQQLQLLQMPPNGTVPAVASTAAPPIKQEAPVCPQTSSP